MVETHEAQRSVTQNQANLARNLAAMEVAAAEVQKAAAALSMSEAEWLKCYEAALRDSEEHLEEVQRAAAEQAVRMEWSALAPRGSQGDGNGDQGDHGGHGGHGDGDEFHTAKHHLEHRWIEKTAFGAAERVVERMTERIGERLAERVGERVGERLVEGVGERLAERSAERMVERGAELALQRAGQGAARHIVGRTIGESLRMTEHAAMHALKALRVLVPFVGMLFVIHLAEHDRHRFVEEWKARRSVSCGLFAIALLGDVTDVLAHVCVICAGLVHIDHGFLHAVENYGMGFAVMACLSVVAGEIVQQKPAARIESQDQSGRKVCRLGAHVALALQGRLGDLHGEAQETEADWNKWVKRTNFWTHHDPPLHSSN